MNFAGQRNRVLIQGSNECRIADRADAGRRTGCAGSGAGGRDRSFEGADRRTRATAWIGQFEQLQAAVERRIEEEAGAADEPSARAFGQEAGRSARPQGPNAAAGRQPGQSRRSSRRDLFWMRWVARLRNGGGLGRAPGLRPTRAEAFDRHRAPRPFVPMRGLRRDDAGCVSRRGQGARANTAPGSRPAWSICKPINCCPRTASSN